MQSNSMQSNSMESIGSMLHIYVIGSGVSYDTGSITPSVTPDKIPNGVQVTLIDAAYDIALATGVVTNEILIDERRRIRDLAPISVVEDKPIPQDFLNNSSGMRIVAMPWWRWIRHPMVVRPPRDETVIFILCDNGDTRPSYEIMDILEESLIENRRYLWFDRSAGRRLDIVSYMNTITMGSEPDFYIEGTHDYIPEEYLKIGEDFLKYMGMIYHDGVSVMKVPGWIFNVQTPFIRGIIDRYNLKAIPYGGNSIAPSDQPPQFLIMNSQNYRIKLYDTVARVMGKIISDE